MTASDQDARRTALTDFESILCVEAAAGTGKTSLLAGRVALMLASGISTRAIVALTFTEAAAAELAAKIEETIEALLGDELPKALRPALQAPLDGDAKKRLRTGKDSLNELQATTIHGFCLTILKAHAVDTGLDPGARILDAPAAEVLFRGEVDAWLGERLGADGRAEDPVVVLAKRSPRDVTRIFRRLAEARREHRDAVATPPPADERPDVELEESLDAFVRWSRSTQPDPRARPVGVELDRLFRSYFGSFLSAPTFDVLWTLANPAASTLFEWKANGLIDYRAALDKCSGADEFAEAGSDGQQLYDRCVVCWRKLQGHIARCLLAQIYTSVDDVLARYEKRKREAALLDFDDLLLKTRSLLRSNEAVRQTVARMHPRILVDEFQDSDPVQIEILFRIAAEQAPANWAEARLRPGSLFVVGDPKQTIYRFRGADTATYLKAKAAIEKHPDGHVLHVRANYRSQKGIVEYVNGCFAEPLGRQLQYVGLEHTVEEFGTLQKASRLTVNADRQDVNAGALRDLEAAAVADLCGRLIGNYSVRRRDGTVTAIEAGDIALLTPAHTELWRYERALEELRIPVASEAGSNLLLRQEAQDIVALVRVLASGSDTLAFGALLRGPLVGLSDQELLDIQAKLPPGTRFTVNTDLGAISNELAKVIIGRLQKLRGFAKRTTPAIALSTAVEQLDVRIALSYRHRQREARALANVDALIERARAYDVRGLMQFAQDLSRDWQDRVAAREGRIDANGRAVSILTMHASKGLEWPVVIPINSSTRFVRSDSFVYSAEENTIRWAIGRIEHPDIAEVRRRDDLAEHRQRERLWYVACTRARDLLIIPRLIGAKDASWHEVVDLGRERLPEFDLESLGGPAQGTGAKELNLQTRESFEHEAAAIARAAQPIVWQRPSEVDPDRLDTDSDPLVVDEVLGAEVPAPIIGAGRVRGLVLHKMMEEVLYGLLADDVAVLELRASVLLEPLTGKVANHPEPAELASTIVRTLGLDIVRAHRVALVPEIPIWASSGGPNVLVRGRADAMAISAGRVQLVFDWKSDVAVTPDLLRAYKAQLGEYLRTTGAPRGALVFMTSGEVFTVEN